MARGPASACGVSAPGPEGGMDGDALLRRSKEYPAGYELALVNLIRERLDAWRVDYAGVTRTTLELRQWWRRERRGRRLFNGHIEAVETVIFLTQARADFLQGIGVARAK